eukprot:757521-Amphidinium_carterae.3
MALVVCIRGSPRACDASPFSAHAELGSFWVESQGCLVNVVDVLIRDDVLCLHAPDSPPQQDRVAASLKRSAVAHIFLCATLPSKAISTQQPPQACVEESFNHHPTVHGNIFVERLTREANL